MIDKKELEKLYIKMSVSEMAKHLNMSRSTLYYHMKKQGIDMRSKSEAQSMHLKDNVHQRIGKKHSLETKEKISGGTQEFWDSGAGKKQRDVLAKLRHKEWFSMSAKDRAQAMNKLQSAPRPMPGELSAFGTKLANFLSEREKITTGIQLISGHVSDIILDDRGVAIELVLPKDIFGPTQELKLENRYNKIVEQLIAAGYKVAVITDKSNSISLARCRRVYEQLQEFFKNKSGSINIIS